MSKRRLEAWFDLVPRQGLVQIDDERQATEYAIRLVECAESETVISKAELRALVTRACEAQREACDQYTYPRRPGARARDCRLVGDDVLEKGNE